MMPLPISRTVSALLNGLCKHQLRRKYVFKQLSASRSYVTSQSPLQWSYVDGTPAPPLLGATIGSLLERAAEKYGSREGYISVHQNLRYSFEDMVEQSDRLAAGLMSLGVNRGDRVGIWAPNCMEWLLAQYGTARAGMILVNINPAYRVSEMEFAMRKVEMKALIAAESFKTSNYYELLQEMVPELQHDDPDRIHSDNLPDLQSIIMISENKLPGTHRFCDVMDMGTGEHRRQILDLQKKLQFDDPINIQFTSGTTGLPKGASLSHHNIVNNAQFVGMIQDYNQDSRICLPVPLYHCFGMVMASMMSVVYGSSAVLCSPSFEPKATLHAVEKERCTALYGTPTMFIDMLEVPDLDKYDLTSLKTGIIAGSTCPIELMKDIRGKLGMPDINIAYGTTENSPVTFMTRSDSPLKKKVETVGQVLPKTEAKIVDESGNIVPIGTCGELYTRGYCVMRGYWNDPEKTDDVIASDRWYKTGDLAVMDEDAYVQIVGRNKDMIIRGGENIYPTEIEQFLFTHPKIVDIQVIGVPDKRLGEEVCAWIKLKEGQTATEQEIRDFCKGNISHFKIPRYIQFVDEYPMTVTGKIQKFKMRQAAEVQLNLSS